MPASDCRYSSDEFHLLSLTLFLLELMISTLSASEDLALSDRGYLALSASEDLALSASESLALQAT